MAACVTLRGTPHSPKGSLVLLCINVFFFVHRHFFLFRPRVFSRALGFVARRKPAGTPGRICGLWPTSVARDLGVESRNSPRGGFPRTQGHPGPSKPTYRLQECPTAHVISGIMNVTNDVRHDFPCDGYVFPRYQHARHGATSNTKR